MSRPAEKTPELDCFLEVQGASGIHAEEVAIALADEIDAWVTGGNAGDLGEAETATEVAKQLRLVGWLVSVDLGADAAKLMDQLETLVARANEVMMPRALSGVRRKFTPAMGINISSLYADDDDLTIVKKAKWDQSRSTNRVLDHEKEEGADDDLFDRPTPPPKG